MKKFFQNIKFKKISLTTLALALVVSGFLVWGNKIEAAVSVVDITSSTLYVQSGNSIDINFNVTADSTNVGIVKIEIYGGSGTPSYNTIYQDNNAIDFVNGTASISRNVSIDDVLPEGSYDLKISAQQSGDWVTDKELDLVVVDKTAPLVESVSVNDGSIAEGDVGDDKFVVTVNFTDTNPMDMVTSPAITFDPTLDTTITNCLNSWTDSNTFTYTCDIADADIESADIDIQVSGAKDAAGNTMSGTFTESNKFDVDTIAPTVTATISPSTGTAKVGDTITATLTAGGSQADLSLSGTCTINGVDVTHSFVNNTGGTYTLSYKIGEAETDQASGDLPVSCTLAETSGNTVTLSSFVGNTLVIDANSPAAPSITSVAGDNKINDSEKTAVIIVGTAEANATISGTLTGTGGPVTVSGTADGSGNFSITVDASGLSDGTLSLSITATDAAGNVSTAGTSSAEKDIVAPTAPVITSIATDNKINDSEKTAVIIVGTAEANATISGTLTGTGGPVTVSGTADGSGNFSITVDASGLSDGTLSLSITATDAAGNVSTAGTSSAEKDTAAPVISTVTSNAIGAGVLKVGDTITFTVTMNAPEDGLVIAPATYNGGTLEWSTADSGATYTATYTIEEEQDDQSPALQLTGVTATDTFGNTSAAVSGSDVVKTIDANKPAGYSVTFDQAYVNNTNKAAISFTFASAEGGATYNYSIDDTNGGTSAVTGTGTISTSTDKITDIDVSTLDNETLTITVTLTDPAGNVGAGVTDTIVKDIVAPTGYTIDFDEDYANISNKESISFTFAGAEASATYNYSIDDTKAETSAVTGSGTISAATDQITGIDVSTLDDETLTITVTLTDPAGNVGAGVTDTIVKETTAPTVTNTHIVTTGNNGTGSEFKNGDIINVSWNNSDAGDDNANIASVTVDFSEFGGEATVVATNTENIWSATYTLPADVNLTGKKVLVTATDTAGNPTTTADDDTYNVDTEKPTVTIDSVTANPTNGDIAVTVEFSEATSDFVIGDISVTGGVAEDFVVTDGDSYTFNVDPNDGASVAVSISIDAGVATDAAGNTNIASNVLSYTSDTVAPVLPVDGIVGTTTQGAGDQIILTFSEAVSPVDGTWSANEFDSIGDPGEFKLSGASFDTTTTGEGYTQLTITLDEDPEDEDTYLWNGTYLTVDPADGAIIDAAGNELSNSAVAGTTAVTGDVLAPDVALTYGDGGEEALVPFQTVRIIATFSEYMDESDSPTITITTAGDGDLAETPMVKDSALVWHYDWSVPGNEDEQGAVTIAISGTDLAGNANTGATNNSRVIDSMAPEVTSITAGSVTTTGATLTVVTDEAAVCKYADSTGVRDYGSMSSMTTSDNLTHTVALTGLDSGESYDYYVKCADIYGNRMSASEHVSFTTNTVTGTGSFGIVSKTMTKMTGTADNSYANGWEWIIRVTLPTDQNSFALKFNDWVSGANTMAAGGNMQYYSEQIASGVGSSANPIEITAANTYPSAVVISTDVDPTLDGIQTDIHVQVKIPTTTPVGSYSTSFQAFYNEPID